MNAACTLMKGAYDAAILRPLVRHALPDGPFRRIFIKPNWVHHADSPHFPAEALVTSPRLIEAVIDECLARYPQAEWIIVGDVPLQSCEWDKLVSQCGLDALERKYRGRPGPRVQFADLRRERFRRIDGFLELDPAPSGDPNGYREVVVDGASYLDPISGRSPNFRVSDYDPGLTTSSHRSGFHRYMIAGSALEADLFINLPKMKTHQKAGVTGALKNLVGINGQKAYLVHHRKGMPSQGGDEFAPATPIAIRLQVRIREALQKRSRFLFRFARRGWILVKRAMGIRTEGTRENLQKGGVYIAAGSWYGNDTIWRMIYDLNRIVRYAPAQGGQLADQPQRHYLAIMDAIVSGEGNGPLQPLLVQSGLLIASEDPFLVDTAMARLMNYDAARIPSLSNRRQFRDPVWGQFDETTTTIEQDGRVSKGLSAIDPLRTFLPPPGWKGHIEN